MTRQFGINKAPRIAVSRANISPFVWWSGGRPLIVIPQLAVDGLTVDHLKGIVAHALGTRQAFGLLFPLARMLRRLDTLVESHHWVHQKRSAGN